ncbi:MAG: response regulator [Lachnospiraceae bacterium]|nr:response regulator [Lachnospiraceae bacterium]
MNTKDREEKAANILIVDDIVANLVVLANMIKQAGYTARPVTSVKQAMQAIDARIPQLILLDISMPDMDGFEFCEILKRNPKTRDIPIIFISAMNSVEDKIRGFKLGAVDFISKPFELEEVTMRVSNHLKIYRMQQELEENNGRLQKVVSEQLDKIAKEQKHILFAMAKLCEARDNADGCHIENVAKGARLLSLSLQLSKKYEKQVSDGFIESIELAAPLHDLGKIAMPDSILLKPGKLTKEEMEVIKTHSEIGADTLKAIYSAGGYNDFIRMAIEIAHFHHEKWDGSGYPLGLKGEEIPLSARIVGVIDVYDTLVSKRCYKDAYTHEESMKIINEESGRSFDPGIIEILNKIQKQLKN